MMVEEGDTPVSSLCSMLDWNNSVEVEKYAVKQEKMLREERVMRVSEYFGHLEVGGLGDEGEVDERIRCLFEEGLEKNPIECKNDEKESKG